MKISINLVRILVILAILINILFLLFKETNLILTLGSIDNLITSVILGVIFYIIVKLTKEEGLGMGDIFLVMFMGLILGWKLTLISITISLLLASLFGISLSVLRKDIKNVKVPLVPFLTLGIFIVLAYSSDLVKILFPFL